MNCNVFVHNFRLQTTITFIFITSLVLSCKFSRTEGHRNPLISACPGEGNSITVYYISISTSVSENWSYGVILSTYSIETKVHDMVIINVFMIGHIEFVLN